MQEAKTRRTIEYQAPGGSWPFREWLAVLKDKRAVAKVLTRLATVRAGSLGDAKSLDGGLYELRIDFGPGYRVYLGLDGQTVVVLLCGGDKSSQGKDIKRARSLWQAYRREKYESRP
ncbi:MAG: type II toxin-antitoxin system RelE/ParE family toxin [Solidesulfovibrio sp.]|uniref:type II toxin-antitoxin system RelE/ParE family toxin n=1 Tax=Solidesulfovibrio sp. TaxID=2910990 RepID=UPI0031589CD2